MRTLQTQSRAFGLLVPLAQKVELPAELESYPLTEAEFAKLEERWGNENASAVEQLKEMNQNKITNIIDRKGIEGWDVKDDMSGMYKTFAFKSADD